MKIFDLGTARALPFAGNPLDRAETLRKDPVRLGWAARDEAARCLLFDADLRLRCRIEGGVPVIDWLPGAGDVFLGLEAGAPRFARRQPEPGQNDDRIKWIDGRSFGLQAALAEAGILAHAKSQVDWHARHGFCAQCGARTESLWGGSKRECVNPACRAEHFPRTDPVVIMLAVHGDACLMGRSHKFTAPVFSALAGFVDQGETIEEAVRRELMEEAGVRTGRVAYAFSQPWPFPSSLMIGCFAEALDRDVNPDGEEIAELRWVTRAEARAALSGENPDLHVPPKIAIARHLLEHFVEAAP